MPVPLSGLKNWSSHGKKKSSLTLWRFMAFASHNCLVLTTLYFGKGVVKRAIDVEICRDRLTLSANCVVPSSSSSSSYSREEAGRGHWAKSGFSISQRFTEVPFHDNRIISTKNCHTYFANIVYVKFLSLANNCQAKTLISGKSFWISVFIYKMKSDELGCFLE